MNTATRFARAALLATIRLYQLICSPYLTPACRYAPSCSAYAHQAVTLHGAARGAWLSLQRVLRCHPWTQGGYDPVP